MSTVTPSDILAAGSLVDVAVTPAQAEAIAAQIPVYDRPSTPCRGLHSWRIPPRGEAFGAAVNAPAPGPVEVHFHYLPEEPRLVETDHIGLEVTIFATDGTVSNSQDYG